MKKARLFFLFLLMIGCTHKKSTDVFLRQPPYNKLTDSINNNPKNESLYYRRGVLLYENNQAAYAERDLKKAWDLKPVEEYALSVVTVLIKKNSDSTIVFIQKALEKIPQSIALQVALARGYQQKGELQKSLSISDKLLSKFPGQIDALLLKSEVLKSLNRAEEALVTLEKAYSIAPFDPELSYNLAFEYAEAKNKKVLALTDSLIKMDSLGGHAEPYYFKGIYYANTGSHIEALKQFDEAIRQDYHFMNAYINKGIIFYDQKKFDGALKVFQKANEVDPKFADAYKWIGKTLEAMGNKEEAKLAYLRAYSLDKAMTEAKEAADKL
jgi:tetratricopeptide (TPR) repeat protein